MAGKPKEFSWNYFDVANLTGLSYDTVRQHAVRGKLDGSRLDLLAIYLATHGKMELRRRISLAALAHHDENIDEPNKDGTFPSKRQAGAKKAAKKVAK